MRVQRIPFEQVHQHTLSKLLTGQRHYGMLPGNAPRFHTTTNETTTITDNIMGLRPSKVTEYIDTNDPTYLSMTNPLDNIKPYYENTEHEKRYRSTLSTIRLMANGIALATTGETPATVEYIGYIENTTTTYMGAAGPLTFPPIEKVLENKRPRATPPAKPPTGGGNDDESSDGAPDGNNGDSQKGKLPRTHNQPSPKHSETTSTPQPQNSGAGGGGLHQSQDTHTHTHHHTRQFETDPLQDPRGPQPSQAPFLEDLTLLRYHQAFTPIPTDSTLAERLTAARTYNEDGTPSYQINMDPSYRHRRSSPTRGDPTRFPTYFDGFDGPPIQPRFDHTTPTFRPHH